MWFMRFVLSIFPIGLMVLATSVVFSQTYPNKPIRIVTSAAGGGNDFKSRIIAQGISAPLGQPVIVDNRSAFVSIETVMKSPPDGYTVLVQGGIAWIYPLMANASFDVVKDLSPITLLVREASLVTVHPSLPVKSVKELIALAKAKPGALNYGSTPTGSSAHLQGELFKSMAGVDIVRVAFKGNGPALIALFSGEVQMMIDGIALLEPHVKSGKLKALAVTSLEPSVQFPGLPTVAASGVPGFEAVQMSGVWAPAKTPEAIIKRLNQEIVRALNQPEVKAKLSGSGGEAGGCSPEEMAAIIKSDIARWSKVIKDVGIKAD